jgi:hypothetical protein
MITNRRTVTYDGITYAPGAQYRVITEGVTLDGMISEGRGAYGGWQQHLQPGDLLTCTGFGPGWGADPGYGVEFTSAESEAARAFNCEVKPSAGSIFSYHPKAGVLEPVTAGS